MVDKKAFKISMVRSNKSIYDISNYLDISYNATRLKINGKNEFKSGEIQKLIPFLGLTPTEVCKIFFA